MSNHRDSTCRQAWENGFDAGFYNKPCDNPYKNFGQCEEYSQGYKAGKKEKDRQNARAKLYESKAS